MGGCELLRSAKMTSTSEDYIMVLVERVSGQDTLVLVALLAQCSTPCQPSLIRQ
jgi:hypothetical protein